MAKSDFDDLVGCVGSVIGWGLIVLVITIALFSVRAESKGWLESQGAYKDRMQELFEDCLWIGILSAIAIRFLISVISKAVKSPEE